MALGGEMVQRFGAVLAEYRRHRGAIADVGANKYVLWIVDDGREIIDIAGIGQLVDGDHPLRRRRSARAPEPSR